jgi:predicted MFS family arabinose efflux permease
MSTTSDESVNTNQPSATDEQSVVADEMVSQAGSVSGKIPSLWRNRDYLLLWSGQLVSSLGTNISGFAFPLLVLFLTHSPAQAGFLGAARSIPYLIFSLPVGALIDRWDRKRVMILCDSIRAIALGSIPLVYALLGTVPLFQLYIVALVEGSLFVFFNIAEVACLPRVVSKEQLPAATGQNQASEVAAVLLGSPLAGLIYSFSKLLPFAADAISYAVSVVSLLFIKAQFQGERSGEHRKLWVEVKEGLVWLWTQPLIRFMAFLTGGLNFTAGITLLVIIIAQRQHASPTVIGILFAIASVGGIVGSVLGPFIQKRFRFGVVIVSMVWVQALCLPLFLVAPNPYWLGVISGVLFVTGPIYNVVQFSYRLALIPDALQGRVNSVFRLLAFGFIPLGMGLTGWLLEVVDVGPTTLIFTACLVVLALAATINPHVRHAKPLAEVEAELAAATASP